MYTLETGSPSIILFVVFDENGENQRIHEIKEKKKQIVEQTTSKSMFE